VCGIVGAFDLSGLRLFPRERLQAMARAIAHRGPDDESFHVEPGLALGVRRLALVDPLGGRQPLSNEDGQVWVAFNGELYDAPELRAELQTRGHTLATRCDTEAWVHLYEDHADDVFLRARGQFAVALWDRSRRTLLLGRDRVGICPLYFTEVDGWLLWASEVKALLASGLVSPRADARALDHLFCFLASPLSRSYFEGVRPVPPGHFLAVRDGRPVLRRYWDLDFPDAGEERREANPEKLVDELEAHLTKAVSRRLRADAGVGAYLSGGLDSSVALALAARVKGEAPPAFTIGLERAGEDERPHAAFAAEALGARLTCVPLDRDTIASTFPALVEAAEGPVIDTADACLLRLSGRVREAGLKAVLTGEGADEAFAGYPWYKSHRVLSWLEAHGAGFAPRWLRGLLPALVGGSERHPPPGLAGAPRFAQADLHAPLARARELLYSEEMWGRLEGFGPPTALDAVPERMHRWDPLHQSLYVEYRVLLAGHLLVDKGDRVAMRSSVEARYPFLDEDLVTFAAGLAPEYKLRGFTDKWLLRQLAARLLPKRLAARPKTMFRALPVFHDATCPAWAEQLLSPESLRATGCFAPEAVARERRLLSRLPAFAPRRYVVEAALTGMVTTQLWHHLFLGGGLCELPTWRAPDLGSAGPVATGLTG
jgi:asparagine synthase (glutamine-hydrolysing)